MAVASMAYKCFCGLWGRWRAAQAGRQAGTFCAQLRAFYSQPRAGNINIEVGGVATSRSYVPSPPPLPVPPRRGISNPDFAHVSGGFKDFLSLPYVRTYRSVYKTFQKIRCRRLKSQIPCCRGSAIGWKKAARVFRMYRGWCDFV